MNKRIVLLVIPILFFSACSYGEIKGVKVGTFLQETRRFYSVEDGLASNNVHAVTIADNGNVYAGTDAGLAVFSDGKWHQVNKISNQPVWFTAVKENTVAAYSAKTSGDSAEGGVVYLLNGKNMVGEIRIPNNLKIPVQEGDMALSDKILISASNGLYALDYNGAGKRIPVESRSLNLPKSNVRQIVVGSNGTMMVAADSGLYHFFKNGWQRVFPAEGHRSWAPVYVRGAAFDIRGRSWFASPQGVGRFDGDWSLFTGNEGLPYNDFTTIAKGEDGVVWFGTHKGAIRFDGKTWEYRQGLRWLPDDDVRDIAVSSNGDAWFATSKGVGVIHRRPMTLSEKAKWYEDEIDRYHRRTPYEYVLEVSLHNPGDKSKVGRHDSDNDGLWTSMYGAGECFAYAATENPKAKARAKKAFEALRFLGQVTQGGSHPAPPGFVARTILPTSGHNPNDGRVQRDKRQQRHGDKLWKVFEPRWPISADGKWYWKTDTSSDELDGHYFFYGQYYDLVAETEKEKERVREHVRALTDHLIKHDFMLVDHDGKPTRWARFNPTELNYDKQWFVERGLNSLSMLSYLATTEHITGDSKYREIADSLIENHSYLQNIMNMKFQRGIGTGNQSDDEMAFMCYYNLLKYDADPERRSRYALSFWLTWRLEQPEMNPFFNFAFAASCADLVFKDSFGTYPTAPTGDWLEDSIETLKRFPLDRINWRHVNSHRLDLVFFHKAALAHDENSFHGRGYRVNGKVLPVDECYFNHWNRDPWQLDTGGSGTEMGDGAVFLLPYYMGLYHGFIIE